MVTNIIDNFIETFKVRNIFKEEEYIKGWKEYVEEKRSEITKPKKFDFEIDINKIVDIDEKLKQYLENIKGNTMSLGLTGLKETIIVDNHLENFLIIVTEEKEYFIYESYLKELLKCIIVENEKLK